jgi:hypothetical protein
VEAFLLWAKSNLPPNASWLLESFRSSPSSIVTIIINILDDPPRSQKKRPICLRNHFVIIRLKREPTFLRSPNLLCCKLSLLIIDDFFLVSTTSLSRIDEELSVACFVQANKPERCLINCFTNLYLELTI